VAEGKGWINVVVEDLDNGSKKTTKTDSDGDFEVDGIIPDDEYHVTPEGGTPAIVTPKGDGDDVGTITITDGMNFKTTGPKDTLLMDGQQHSITLSITNTGTEDAIAVNYHLEFENGLISSGATKGILGTIEPGRTSTINTSLGYNPQDRYYLRKKIFITMTDPINNKTWKDSISVRFYDSSKDIPFSMRATKPVSGIIISPNYQTFRFSGSNAYLRLQRSPGEYLVVFSGASADTEAVYSFSIKGNSVNNLDDFADTGNYEPNNTEQTAVDLQQVGDIVSYLHKNDIDYYKFNIYD
jgi:hypothetical protein